MAMGSSFACAALDLKNDKNFQPYPR